MAIFENTWFSSEVSQPNDEAIVCVLPLRLINSNSAACCFYAAILSMLNSKLNQTCQDDAVYLAKLYFF
jgi:hypothetical protein